MKDERHKALASRSSSTQHVKRAEELEEGALKCQKLRVCNMQHVNKKYMIYDICPVRGLFFFFSPTGLSAAQHRATRDGMSPSCGRDPTPARKFRVVPRATCFACPPRPAAGWYWYWHWHCVLPARGSLSSRVAQVVVARSGCWRLAVGIICCIMNPWSSPLHNTPP
jgi:hypothetical protein